MTTRIFTDGVLTELWDDAARTYTAWSPAGVQLSTRPYTPAETSAANAEAARATLDGNRATVAGRLSSVDLPAMQAILDTPNAQLGGATQKDMARAIRRIIRKLEGILDGVD